MNSAHHSSTGETPHEVVFGQRMAMHARDYNETIEANSSTYIGNRSKFLGKIQNTLNESYNVSNRRYNLRTRELRYEVGDTVYRKNTILSNKLKYFSKKLAPRFVKCEITERTGTNTYKLKDLNTGKIAVHHASNFHK